LPSCCVGRRAAAPITILEERTVGAELGADSIHAGAVPALSGYPHTHFMVLFYGLFGIFADVALLSTCA